MVENRLGLPRAATEPQGERYALVRPAEGRYHPLEEVPLLERDTGAYTHPAPTSPAKVPECLLEVLFLLEHAASRRVDLATGGGQAYRPMLVPQQLGSEFPRELLDVPRDRGLREVHVARRRRVAVPVDDVDEDAQSEHVQCHRRP